VVDLDLLIHLGICSSGYREYGERRTAHRHYYRVRYDCEPRSDPPPSRQMPSSGLRRMPNHGLSSTSRSTYRSIVLVGFIARYPEDGQWKG
jgi:hypothetical protein